MPVISPTQIAAGRCRRRATTARGRAATAAPALLVALAGLIVILGSPTAWAVGAVVIDFEDYQANGAGQLAGAALTGFYAARGVTFDPVTVLDFSQGVAQDGFAHSGTKAIEPCYAQEFCNAPVAMTFATGQSGVSVWVGLTPRPGESSCFWDTTQRGTASPRTRRPWPPGRPRSPAGSRSRRPPGRPVGPRFASTTPTGRPTGSPSTPSRSTATPS